eukprot:scaffold137688_cov17-Prasinocladus_malaysianus.AAC.1
MQLTLYIKYRQAHSRSSVQPCHSDKRKIRAGVTVLIVGEALAGPPLDGPASAARKQEVVAGCARPRAAIYHRGVRGRGGGLQQPIGPRVNLIGRL